MGMRMKLAAAAAAVVVAFGSSAAFAAGTVEVSLWDRPGVPMAMDMGLGMAGNHDNAAMGITATATTLTAGEITFNVKNDSTTMIHEMVVVPIADATTAPAYVAAAMAVDEDAAGAIGEVEELAPGASGSVTLNLAAGTYILICNVPGHYAAGMWTVITVAP